jgi:hypothetical protein
MRAVVRATATSAELPRACHSDAATLLNASHRGCTQKPPRHNNVKDGICRFVIYGPQAFARAVTVVYKVEFIVGCSPPPLSRASTAHFTILPPARRTGSHGRRPQGVSRSAVLRVHCPHGVSIPWACLRLAKLGRCPCSHFFGSLFLPPLPRSLPLSRRRASLRAPRARSL